METFGERLRVAMGANGLRTAAALSNECRGKISRQQARHWLKKERANVEAETLMAVADCLHVRLHWLINGKGPMYRSPVGQQ